MPNIIRVQIAGHGYQICPSCTGLGCHKCHGMGEVPAISGQKSAVRSQQSPPRSLRPPCSNPALSVVKRIVNQAKNRKAQ